MEIEAINEVQSILARANKPLIDLPMIVAVGDQSAGKSSVIERMMGREILPKGSGIVTRRPLIIQMCNIQDSVDKYEFAHAPGKIFSSEAQVMQEISDETERLCGGADGKITISNVPISLKISSQKLTSLTVVDLPGITRIAVAGQNEDIVTMLYEMVLSFVKNEKALILAIMPANQDIANSGALKISREVDPTAKRTIGVITKIDLMDKGTDCLQILNGTQFKLQKGFIGLVNRNQEQIHTKFSYEKSIELEEQFFKEHPIYSQIAHKSGTKYLQNYLQQELTEHIKHHSKGLNRDFRIQLTNLKHQISQMSVQLNKISKETVSVQICRHISKFSTHFSEILALTNIFIPNLIKADMTGSNMANVFQYINETIAHEMIKYLIPKPQVLSAQIIQAKSNLRGLDVEIPKTLSRQILYRADRVVKNSHVYLKNSLSEALKNSITLIESEYLQNLSRSILASQLSLLTAKSEALCIEIVDIYSNGLISSSRLDESAFLLSFFPCAYSSINNLPTTLEFNISESKSKRKAKIEISYQSFVYNSNSSSTSKEVRIPKGLYFIYDSDVKSKKISNSSDPFESRKSLHIYNYTFSKLTSTKNEITISPYTVGDYNEIKETLIKYGFMDRTAPEASYIKQYEQTAEFAEIQKKYGENDSLEILKYLSVCKNFIESEIKNMAFLICRMIFKILIFGLKDFISAELLAKILSTDLKNYTVSDEAGKLEAQLSDLKEEENLTKKIINQLKVL